MSFLVEKANAGDAEAIAAVHARGLVAGYRGRVPSRVLSVPRGRPQVKVWARWLERSFANTWVIRIDGKVAGFCTLQSTQSLSGTEAVAEVPVIVVDPAHWRTGVGRTLLKQALAHATELGFGHVLLWVLESNRPARELYASLGFRPDGDRRVFAESSDGDVLELRYRRTLQQSLG